MVESKKIILYVDDEQINLRVFQLMFKNQFHIITALSAAEAVEKLAEHPGINFVISDYRMPEINGFDFILNVQPIYKEKNFFMLSGFDQPVEVNHAIEQGVIKKYFTKPMNKVEILSALEN